ncbi:MAG TPA: LacI family DNA-binding transcriptional regulator [Candidatus Limnocylindrales bacterium]|nr:LacI family DNA-binding transcriptional regulator [Candidatus Limnocylindrales bacterium]
MAITNGNGRARTLPKRAPGLATLEEVARVAGVSRATVSRVVNDSPRVSPDVRQAVERAIESLGYVPNRAARSLVTRRSDSVAVVITEPTGRLFSDPFFPRLLRGISAELAGRDRQLVLVMPESAADERRAAAYLSAGHVDGVLLTSLHGDDALPRELLARGVPVVVGGRPIHGEQVSYVDVDNRAGGREAVAHLAARGRRTIATIAGPHDMAVGIDRLAGYRDGLTAAGLAADPGLVAEADFTHDGGARAMRSLLDARPDLDAVFAASDAMAAGALSELLAAGRRVPEDVAVVGYDDSPIAAATRPPLTSVRQPIEEMGREMARLLVESIGRGERAIRRVVLATELVTRASTEVKARH